MFSQSSQPSHCIAMASKVFRTPCLSWFASSTIHNRRVLCSTSFLRRHRKPPYALNTSLKLVTIGDELERKPRLRTLMFRRAKAEDEEEVLTKMTTEMDEEEPLRSVMQVALWVMALVYSSYLFLLPFAPGDPVWAISPAAITGILNLSFNFFFIVPLANLAGFHLVKAAVVHPVDEAVFNFVLGWIFLFAPLLFTDRKRDRFTGSLDALWLGSMLLTNTFLIPYMAIRLNKPPPDIRLRDPTPLQQAFTTGAGPRIVAVTGAAVGLVSIVWFIAGGALSEDGDFGDLAQRWSYWLDAVSRDRLSYAFVWDLCCFALLQPWLVGENLDQVRGDWREGVGKVRWVPYVGLLAYCWGLESSKGKRKEEDDGGGENAGGS